MSNISSVDIFICDLPVVRPHKLSMTTITSQAIVIGIIKDESGITGVSEVATIGGASYGESTVEAIKANIDQYITPHLIGQDPISFNRIMNNISKSVRGNYFAKSLIETALIDLAAKQREFPAYELFGGKIHNSLPLAWTLASGDTARDIEEAKEMLHQKRHNIFKLKIGSGDPDANVKHVGKIIKAVGDESRITVDINQAWDEYTALKQIKALEEMGVSMIEQPLPAWNYEGMSRLTERFDVSILADEAATSLHDTYRIIKARAGDAIALKPAKHGGILETKKIAGIAEAAGFGLYGGTMIESTIGNAVAASVYSTIPEFKFGTEIFGPLLYKDKLTLENIEVKDFEIQISDDIGFGVTLDYEKLEYYKR
ncbi:muconate cycloisomerase I [Jeotgalicoccus coquinae]|uniref:Muconate cycloisomerase 1 n=1 Tax=Jeotgalicoccus coquinae TaxID=709509 RepID=A0A6V7RQX0_9STAP|nr:muconate/chloromuconate family cycloisomerase [Jeotgalicoccus coquinae]MBB6424134.1 muconate/chloromuconate cycloisomerase [Jeotgalicoccus coquinae]GGE26228.1 muconate cycloisomerase I [Jeotgalicoccus coquinae]CAD2081365.1 Muconate cycloisomerase 1 [Jeotgalicoccus coquinae]